MAELRWLRLLFFIPLPGVSYLLWFLTRSRTSLGEMPVPNDPAHFAPQMVLDEYFPPARYAILHLFVPLLVVALGLGTAYTLLEGIMALCGIPSRRRNIVRLLVVVVAILIALGGTWLMHDVSGHQL